MAAAPKEPPARAAHVWRYFLELSRTRQTGGMGPSRLSRLEIRQWEADECVSLDLWERRAIIALDGIWFTHISAQMAQEREPVPSPSNQR